MTAGKSFAPCRRLLIGVVAVFLAAAGMAVAAASSLSIQASSTDITFNRHVVISGRVAGPISGHQVKLLASQFDQSAYRAVAVARVRHGSYRFSVVPGIATSYEVAPAFGSSAHSPVLNVYVEPVSVNASCNLCVSHPPTGHEKLRVWVKFKVPAVSYRVLKKEQAFLYYGTASGTVQTEKRVETLKVHGLGNSVLELKASYKIDLRSGWAFHYTICAPDNESQSGLGKPSPHVCGYRRLSRRQFDGYLG
jgi:hypothetical protein